MADRASFIVKLPYSSAVASAINKATQSALPEPAREAEAAPTKIISHFTKSQLALAFVIQKAKPETLSTHEYCQQLRESIKSGRPISSDTLRYIDTCEFWKDQYSKIHLEKKVLQDEVYRLEEARRQLLESLCGQMNHPSLGSSSSQLLGGSGFNDQEENGAPRKRPAHAEEERADDQEQIDKGVWSSEDNFLRMSSYVLRIGRQRNSLEKAVKDTSTLDHINTLAEHIILALVLLENALSNTCLPLRLLKADDDQRSSLLVEQVMRHVGLSFLSCFKAMNELRLTIPGRARMPEMVYRMVIFFSNSLNLLHRVAALQAEHEAAEDSRRPRHKRRRIEEGEYVVNRCLANSLASIVCRLEWKVCQPGHADLLEGMLFSILEHTGHLVSEAVFAEHVATSDNPGNITKDDYPSTSGSVKHESRYIVKVLQATLGGSDRRELVAQVLTAGKPNLDGQAHARSSALSSALSSGLLSTAKKLLQSTLVKSAAGGADLETLRLPTPPVEEAGLPVEVTYEVEKYGSEWLIESVWGIIGWDMVI